MFPAKIARLAIPFNQPQLMSALALIVSIPLSAADPVAQAKKVDFNRRCCSF